MKIILEDDNYEEYPSRKNVRRIVSIEDTELRYSSTCTEFVLAFIALLKLYTFSDTTIRDCIMEAVEESFPKEEDE